MARKLRYIPDPPTLVSITCRTVQGRFLFKPGPAFNDRFLGILGRTQRRHEMVLNAVSVLSNHFHVLAVPESANQLAAFMRDLQSKLARETNRLTGWRGPVFERRYEMTVVTEEDRAQIERLAYVLSQSVKEGLVERIRQWPGVHSAPALIDGTPLTGHWLDRTREYAARNRRMETPPQFATEESVRLSPIPCWAHLPPEVYRARVAALVEAVESEAALARSLKGLSVLGVEAILAKDPQHRPAALARSPAPLLVHAATKAVRKAFYDAYAWFVTAYRDAAERLRQGDRDAPFPCGSFPPALPFVAG